MYDLKKVRNELHVTQEELARLLGVPLKTVSRWENGHFNPNFTNLKKITALCAKKNIKLHEKNGANNAKRISK